MPTVTLIAIDGTQHRFDARSGESLMLAALRAGVAGIAADCGGCLSCATCHVHVDEEWQPRLPAISPDEEAMLAMTAAERRPGSRLSCEIRLDETLDGFVAHLPPTQY